MGFEPGNGNVGTGKVTPASWAVVASVMHAVVGSRILELHEFGPHTLALAFVRRGQVAQTCHAPCPLLKYGDDIYHPVYFED